MNNKLFSLKDIVKLNHNAALSEQYVRYLCGISADKQYRHQEILDICTLINSLHVGKCQLDGFIYGYVVPQLNKEFDLLKITSNCCINIELKSEEVSREQQKRQLIQNKHYLKLINNERLWVFAFISSTKKVFTIDDGDELVECSINELEECLKKLGKGEYLDLDTVFAPSNILVSPLNSTKKFIEGNYLLTEHQENVKKEVIQAIQTNTQGIFFGVTGGPGTGKTLLIYDIARELAKTFKILVIHSGILCEGHQLLNKLLENIKIIAAKELKYREIKDVDIVIVDEAHRLYTDSLDKVERWVKRTKTSCLFSYDAKQTLSNSENHRNTSEKINILCESRIYKLKNKIRTNKELSLFINCLQDLSKYRDEYSFPNVKIIYEPNEKLAYEIALKMDGAEYTYISYTPSIFQSKLDFQSSKYNTHNVIGQEFEGVCMVLDGSWRYVDNKLIAPPHPNPDYLFSKLLYQGLTRVRSRLAIIVCSEDLLKNILSML